MLNSVKINKENLIEILKKNAKSHQEKYEKAYKNWVIAYKEMLEKLTKKAEKGKPIPFHKIKLDKPKSYLASYEETIGMLELSVEENIVLTQNDYRQFVLDKWSWTNEFAFSSASYNSSSSSSSTVNNVLELAEVGLLDDEDND